MRKKTLHFFSEFYYPASNSTSFYITRIIHSCVEKWDGDCVINCATDNDGKEILCAPNIRIRRFTGGKIGKNNLASRLFKLAMISINFFMVGVFTVKKGDTVFCVTNPAFLLVFLSLLRNIIHFNFVLLVYDIFPEVLIPSGLTQKDSLKYRIILKIFNSAYNRADSIIVIGRDMKDVVESKIEDRNKIVFIPNWADTENIIGIPKDNNPILKRLGIEKNFIFSIAGNMGRTQGLENIISAIQLLKGNDNTTFLFMGGGAKKKDLKEQVKNSRLNNILITGWIPDEERNAMLSAGDIAVISLAKGMYGLSVPSKTYFNLAARKPLLLIADDNSEIALLIREHKIGWVVKPGDPQALADAFNAIRKTNRDDLESMGIRARNIVESQYNEKEILKEYQRVICNI